MKEEIAALANCEQYMAEKLIWLVKKYVEEQPEMS